MKITPLVRKVFVLAAVVGVMSAISAQGADNSRSKKAARVAASYPAERIVLVHVTGSYIPRQVVLVGNTVNGAEPMYVLQSRDMLRSGSATIEGMLSMDPSISFRRVH